MIAMEWIPLVLRALESGDQSQTLFTIHCSPHVAAYYMLDQLLNCFDEALISLLVLQDKTTQGQAFALLTELFCLHRHHQGTELLNKLIKGWGRMNTLHILLVYLQRAQPEERPLVAAILLQLDLLGDPNILGLTLPGDPYRYEAVEEIVKVLDSQVLNEKVQEQSARTILILAGHFSDTGEPVSKKWLLKQAGFDEHSLDVFYSNNVAINNFTTPVREDEAGENWQRRTAMILIKSGRKNLLVALSDSMANGKPCLASASLVTVTWISSILQSSGERSLPPLACSTLVPQLVEALNSDNSMEERILASFSLLSLLKGSDCVDGLQTSIPK